MYYITNHNNQMIAASSELLKKINIETVDLFYRQIATGDIALEKETDALVLDTPAGKQRYRIEEETLFSLLGEMRLIHLVEALAAETDDAFPLSALASEEEITFGTPEEEEEAPLFSLEAETSEEPEPQKEEEDLLFEIEEEQKPDEKVPEEEEDLLFEIKETPLEEADGAEEEEVLFELKEPEKEEEDVLFKIEETPEGEEEAPLFDLEVPDSEEEAPLFELKASKKEEEATPPETEEATAEASQEEEVLEDDIFSLILPSDSEETIETLEPLEEKKPQKKHFDIPDTIDIEKAAQSIGISPADYRTFLSEYANTAQALRDDLKNRDEEKRAAAIHTLYHLSNVLKLPHITEMVEHLQETEGEEAEETLRTLYGALEKLQGDQAEEAEEERPEVATAIEEAVPEEETAGGFGTIDLSDVKPIHFDFRVEEAAEELSLPAELIEEFIHDFIKQAHEETEKMLEAYKRGDLDSIQKIGHLLKGTSSNLRIHPLADTLYEIQFCEDSSKLEALIRDYWAHFLAFETQFTLSAQKGK